ncbi:Uma2 family endonuclease [uncultured Thiodictyon sp.]|uniref:Uma2 family endonuclease n=1 Tax=uncultured Thiodictyon sp. TaxID=1846217 RepID=UPI0025CD7A77|nr:Uma2 family endonuclease [uncultured Thiodictyon sp.]
MSALAKLSPQAYLEQERQSALKHEYCNGEAFAMAGASPAHNPIMMNIGAALHVQLKRRPCRVYPSDLRILLADGHVYPDLTVVCGAPEFAEGDNLRNPTLICEVLSQSTADYDMGGEFARYRQLPSLRDYLVVAQDRMALMLYSRQDDRRWLLTDITDPQTTLELPGIGCALEVADVYDKVFEG